MSNDLVILSKSELLAIRNSLQFCNDSPNGGISDTLWMMDSPETIFDAFDELLEKAQVVDSESVGTLEVDKYGAYSFTLAPYVEFMCEGKHKLYLTPQPVIPEEFQLVPIDEVK